jgi:hypothetical protein
MASSDARLPPMPQHLETAAESPETQETANALSSSSACHSLGRFRGRGLAVPLRDFGIWPLSTL